jgi:hypothetical protein
VDYLRKVTGKRQSATQEAVEERSITEPAAKSFVVLAMAAF